MMQMNTIKHSSNAMLQVFDFLHKKGAPHKKLKSSGLQDLRRPNIGESQDLHVHVLYMH